MPEKGAVALVVFGTVVVDGTAADAIAVAVVEAAGDVAAAAAVAMVAPSRPHAS